MSTASTLNAWYPQNGQTLVKNLAAFGARNNIRKQYHIMVVVLFAISDINKISKFVGGRA